MAFSCKSPITTISAGEWFQLPPEMIGEIFSFLPSPYLFEWKYLAVWKKVFNKILKRSLSDSTISQECCNNHDEDLRDLHKILLDRLNRKIFFRDSLKSQKYLSTIEMMCFLFQISCAKFNVPKIPSSLVRTRYGDFYDEEEIQNDNMCTESLDFIYDLLRIPTKFRYLFNSEEKLSNMKDFVTLKHIRTYNENDTQQRVHIQRYLKCDSKRQLSHFVQHFQSKQWTISELQFIFTFVSQNIYIYLWHYESTITVVLKLAKEPIAVNWMIPSSSLIIVKLINDDNDVGGNNEEFWKVHCIEYKSRFSPSFHGFRSMLQKFKLSLTQNEYEDVKQYTMYKRMKRNQIFTNKETPVTSLTTMPTFSSLHPIIKSLLDSYILTPNNESNKQQKNRSSTKMMFPYSPNRTLNPRCIRLRGQIFLANNKEMNFQIFTNLSSHVDSTLDNCSNIKQQLKLPSKYFVYFAHFLSQRTMILKTEKSLQEIFLQRYCFPLFGIEDCSLHAETTEQNLYFLLRNGDMIKKGDKKNRFKDLENMKRPCDAIEKYELSVTKNPLNKIRSVQKIRHSFQVQLTLKPRMVPKIVAKLGWFALFAFIPWLTGLFLNWRITSATYGATYDWRLHERLPILALFFVCETWFNMFLLYELFWIGYDATFETLYTPLIMQKEVYI
ncbi:hypothetical protein C9374_011846 [Naegleria lovaniensis]|uniref:F-box domain-containing protein n=1 Tax=Naegleria lovaniensis TaxID=51637 RepID=A0AA88G9G3_NAELO|nr:uncharacterized protein C9374_011846 [Naegleria lovaniensis]KAG2373757.1 hypothetical protein C9374_011846 [Naegleria lovaniensis]